MKHRKIRIGVAGLGRIGWLFHCDMIGKSRDFKLVAVTDTDAAYRRDAEDVYGCRAFGSFDTMLSEVDLDAVVIATPTHFHNPHALAALRNGLHVMLEKPMALNLAEAHAIASAAKRAKRTLTVYQPRRAIDWFKQAREIAESGKIGEIYHVRIAMFSFARRNDWQSLKKYGGGMLNNYGAHVLDQALAITGYDVKDVFCRRRRVATLGDTDDVVKVVYETRSGILGEVDINQACVTTPYEFELFGTRGVIQKDGQTLRIRHFPASRIKPKSLDATLRSAGRKYPSDSIRFIEKTIKINPRYQVDVYKDFANAIRTGARPFVDPAETLAVMKLIEKCRATSGRIRQTPL